MLHEGLTIPVIFDPASGDTRAVGTLSRVDISENVSITEAEGSEYDLVIATRVSKNELADKAVFEAAKACAVPLCT